MKKENSLTKKKRSKKTSHYKRPANPKVKPEVVEVLATPPKQMAKMVLKGEDDIEAEMTKIAFDEDIAGILRMSLLQVLMNTKHARREQARKDEQLKLEKEKVEIFKAKTNVGEELTYEDTSLIDEQIMKEIGLVNKNEKDTNN